MWRRNFIIWIVVALAMGCAENGVEREEEEPVFQTRSTTFSGGAEGVSVLVFNKNGGNYTYQQSITSGWSSDGHVDARLVVGDYKFLFMKTPGVTTSLMPATLSENVKFEDIYITSRPDPENTGYCLPVDEIFLPATPAMADTVYSITGQDSVRCTLTRAVSRVILHLKRAAENGGQYDSFPYTSPASIMDEVQKVKMRISNVGEALNIEGGIGTTNTYYATETADLITPSGFAVLQGPFVFPSGTGGESRVEITLDPKTGSAFSVLKTEVSGLLERNRQLIVTLWVTSTYRLVEVSAETAPITDIINGDSGIWE